MPISSKNLVVMFENKNASDSIARFSVYDMLLTGSFALACKHICQINILSSYIKTISIAETLFYCTLWASRMFMHEKR